jgi:hypothetical protein
MQSIIYFTNPTFIHLILLLSERHNHTENLSNSLIGITGELETTARDILAYDLRRTLQSHRQPEAVLQRHSVYE